jgi:hypothetical protein
MRSRLWLIVFLLVWTGQWVIGVPELLPVPAVLQRAVWLQIEDLAALVVYQMPW